jgi:hypothetical protein
MTKAGDRILKAANEALAFAEGTADIASYRIHPVSAPDIRAIRTKTGLSQALTGDRGKFAPDPGFPEANSINFHSES